MTPKILEDNLLAENIYIASTKYNPRETIFSLSCGVRVTLFNMSGKVVVKGQVKNYVSWDAIAALRRVLPDDTVWLHTYEKANRSAMQ